MKKTNEQFLKDSRYIHEEEFYDYIEEYKTNKEKIIMYCKVCGNLFKQSPSNHLQGRGWQIRKFLDSKSIEETCVAESEAEHFLNSNNKKVYVVLRSITSRDGCSIGSDRIEKVFDKKEKAEEYIDSYCKNKNIKLIRIWLQ